MLFWVTKKSYINQIFIVIKKIIKKPILMLQAIILIVIMFLQYVLF